jgi:hypothetical protein
VKKIHNAVEMSAVVSEEKIECLLKKALKECLLQSVTEV